MRRPLLEYATNVIPIIDQNTHIGIDIQPHLLSDSLIVYIAGCWKVTIPCERFSRHTAKYLSEWNREAGKSESKHRDAWGTTGRSCGGIGSAEERAQAVSEVSTVKTGKIRPLEKNI